LSRNTAPMLDEKSLRDTESLPDIRDARRYHSGLPRLKHSTLADACHARPVAVFAGPYRLAAALGAGLTCWPAQISTDTGIKSFAAA